MSKVTPPLPSLFALIAATLIGCIVHPICGFSQEHSAQDSLRSALEEGRRNSRLLRQSAAPSDASSLPKMDRQTFLRVVRPIFQAACIECHGPASQEGGFRADTLTLDFLRDGEIGWWSRVLGVISKGEMPPADAEVRLTGEQRGEVVDWLAEQLHLASKLQQGSSKYTRFRRMTRYETNYALQDLLGLPFDFVADLPPESPSEDGFLNSSAHLKLTASQLASYRELARTAIQRAIVRGERPTPVVYSISMRDAADVILQASQQKWETQQNRAEDARRPQRVATDSLNSNAAHFVSTLDNTGVQGTYSYPNARYSIAPNSGAMNTDKVTEPWGHDILVLPVGARQILDLGDHLPDAGTMRLRIRARLGEAKIEDAASLQVSFGFQASNNSQASFRIGEPLAIDSFDEGGKWFEIQIALGEIPRNPFRHVSRLGVTPNPSEYLVLQNVGRSRRLGVIQIDHIEVIAPYITQWPPESHRRVLGDFVPESETEAEFDAALAEPKIIESQAAKKLLAEFMPKAWRRPISDSELLQKVSLFESIRPNAPDFAEAMVDVLATVIASPKFIYLDVAPPNPSDARRDEHSAYRLATKLAAFLWCSVPDQQLLDLASDGSLLDAGVLAKQCERMLDDPKSRRFTEQFTRQWLGMELLEYLAVDKKRYRGFDESLRRAMAREPIEFFRYMLENDRTILDIVHADYVLVNNRLAEHYQLPKMSGANFRRVSLPPELPRGGLLTQPALLAMNSDGKDSHPLKRGIWLLERILNDPPPPPPPAVPEIDLTDPEILKLTLKQRMEDHRNDVACMSCHVKIDPWGIAFEHYDATGAWRESVGDQPVDATAALFNKVEIDGIDGLKRYMLLHRQDQVIKSLTHKLSAFALGRPISFSDEAALDAIAQELRLRGDGLRSLVKLIVKSDLFHTTPADADIAIGAR